MDVINIKDELDIGPTEYIFETINLPGSTKNISLWSNDETKQLIDLYKSFIGEVGPSKRFTRKKDMWSEISLQIPNKNSKQCEERFKTLLRRKKKGIENGNISDLKRKMIDVENNSDETKNIFQIIKKNKLDNKIDTLGYKEVHVWSNDETKLLFELYKSNICEVGPQKRFMHKKDMWKEISKNFPNKDASQCLQRYNTVLKRTNNNFTKVYISKARGKMIAFKTKEHAEKVLKIKRIYALKNYKMAKNFVKPKPDTKQMMESVEQNNTKPVTVKNDGICETLLKIAAKQEESRERRHREKMQAFEQIQNVLQQLLKSKTKF